MRNTFVNELISQAEKNDKIQLITGDLGYGVLNKYWEKYPNQFINDGISEQSMTGIAAGMALEGNIVFTYSIGNFPTMRCLEQIRNDCAYHNANVKIVCVGGGLVYGAHGMSHHATEDIAIMRALPNVVVTAPADPIEAKCITKQIIQHQGTCYMRLGKGGEKNIHKQEINNYKLGNAIKIEEGDKIAIFSTGAILDEVIKVRKSLAEKNINCAVYSFPTIKPLDTDVINKYAKKAELIVTVEEHNIIGGFGSAVAEVMAEQKERCQLLRIGLNDVYSSIVGNQEYLRKVYGIDANSIEEKILKAMGEQNGK